MNNLFVNGSQTVGFTDMLYKGAETALIAEIVLYDIFLITLIRKSNSQTCIKEGRLTQMIFKYIVVVLCSFLENKSVGLEFDISTRNIRITDNGKVRCDITSLKSLMMNVSVLRNLNLHPFGKSINYR